MASPGGKRRQFNDGTRPPDATPATTGPPTSNQPSDSLRTQIFHRPIESGDDKGLEADSEGAINASQQSSEMIVDANLTRTDETTPEQSDRMQADTNLNHGADFQRGTPQIPSPAVPDRTPANQYQMPGPDDVRLGEPAVLDVERACDARIEMNLGPEVRGIAFRDVLLTIYTLAQQTDPAFVMGSFDRTQIWAQPQELPRTNLEDLLKQRTRTNRSDTTLVVYLHIFSSKTITFIANNGPLKPYLGQN